IERDLFLTLQLIDMGLPMVVALNMADEARKQGVAIDRDLLEDLLGVPVIETVAVRGSGIDELTRRIADAREGNADREVEAKLLPVAAITGSRAAALLVCEGDETVAARYGVTAASPEERDVIYTRRRARVNDIVSHVLTETTQGAGLGAHISYLLMHPLTGIPALGALLYLIYKVLGEWLAGDVVGFMETTVMKGYYEPFVRGLVGRAFAAGSAPHTFLAGEFGVLTMTVTYLIGVILPLVAGFYLLMSVLEDSGYLPRIAALADRSLTALGLNGRAVIPLILGLGCVTMGTLTTRILGSKRERFIATALMAIAVPCSAQIAVISALMSRVGGAYALVYFAVLVVIFVVLGTVLNKITPGVSTDLLIDLPPLRVPRPQNVVRKSAMKVWHFMKEVSVFFLVGSALISTLQVTGALSWIQAVARPLTVSWLHLPPEAATAFVMGFVRRDFGAAGFFTMHLSATQLLVAMVTITLFVPCVASMMVIVKERGWRYFTGLVLLSVSGAFFVGGLLTRLLETLS
ncbi:MAG: ferrous iron transporter B, partial [Coriobacteriales bacterium]